jgi:hypothetical protein
MHPGPYHQRAILGEQAFAALDRFFHQPGRAEVEVDRLKIAEAVSAKAKSGVGHGRSKDARKAVPHSGTTSASQMLSVWHAQEIVMDNQYVIVAAAKNKGGALSGRCLGLKEPHAPR